MRRIIVRSPPRHRTDTGHVRQRVDEYRIVLPPYICHGTDDRDARAHEERSSPEWRPRPGVDIADTPQVRVRQQHHWEFVKELRAPRRARCAVKEDAADEHDYEEDLCRDELEGQAPFLREPPADVRGDCKY